MRGGCGETLYNLDYHFNIYDDDFLEKFNLKIVPTICKKTGVCDCQPETNSRKRYLESSKNFIPIISVFISASITNVSINLQFALEYAPTVAMRSRVSPPFDARFDQIEEISVNFQFEKFCHKV
jgi:hypothetical protein